MHQDVQYKISASERCGGDASFYEASHAISKVGECTQIYDQWIAQPTGC